MALDPKIAVGDYHLPSESPCIDQGSNTYASGITDIDGDYRFLDGGVGSAVVDMGADEYSPAFTAVTVLTPENGEILSSGSTHAIGWGAPTKAVSFNVLYSTDKGATWKLIQAGVQDKAINWSVPLIKANSSKCLIKVMGYDVNGKLVGTGASLLFTIEVIHFVNPAPGEVIHPGTEEDPLLYTIGWNAENPDAMLFKLYYSTNNGASWVRGDKTQYGVSGSTYQVPMLAPDAGNTWMMLKIEGYNDLHKKVAEGISGKFLLEVLEITAVNRGNPAYSGQSGSVSWHLWDAVDPVSKVVLYSSLNGGATWQLVQTITDSS